MSDEEVRRFERAARGGGRDEMLALLEARARVDERVPVREVLAAAGVLASGRIGRKAKQRVAVFEGVRRVYERYGLGASVENVPRDMSLPRDAAGWVVRIECVPSGHGIFGGPDVDTHDAVVPRGLTPDDLAHVRGLLARAMEPLGPPWLGERPRVLTFLNDEDGFIDGFGVLLFVHIGHSTVAAEEWRMLLEDVESVARTPGEVPRSRPRD